jgi:hypothetical protein
MTMRRETRRVNLKWSVRAQLSEAGVDLEEHSYRCYSTSDDDAVAVAASTPGFIINLAWGLFRDRGSEDGEERIHYWLFEISCL